MLGTVPNRRGVDRQDQGLYFKGGTDHQLLEHDDRTLVAPAGEVRIGTDHEGRTV